MKPRPAVLGIVGGIGSGKSLASAVLARHGARILDADQLARDALQNPEVVGLLQERFGNGIRTFQGEIDRDEVSRRVFGQPEELAWLESVIHPRVRRAMETELRALLRDRTVPAVVLDVPLLLERSPFHKHCDLVICVECPEEIRRRRVEALRGWSPGELARREFHQMSTAEKRAAADIAFRNDGTPEELEARIERWLQTAGGFGALPRRAAPLPPEGPL